MSETADIVQQISALRCEHRQLDEAIARITQDAWIDQLDLTRMKRRKLRIKDMIAYLESRLIPDLGA
ncbi:MAG TPA: YdcH family protein [Chiayiivirga sp.]|mgnify:CR=1 FL=1|nr:YdcH family protein [Chiayiivirga sp.]